MRSHKLAILLLAAVPAFLVVQAKDKKPNVSPVFNSAHTIYVEAHNGQQFDRYLDPEDRAAIADVQDLLQAWKRYKLVTQREDADIVIVVRKGHGAANPDGSISPNDIPNRGVDPNSAPNGMSNRNMDPNAGPIPGQQRANGPMMAPGIDSLATQDLFEVCQVNANGKLTRPIWSRSLEDGLRGPHVMLFQQFRDAVDNAYPSQPERQGAKP
jgi:hypothetical protein